MPSTPRQAVETYLESWASNDFDAMRATLRDDLQFAGPIDTFDSADALQEALRGLSQIKQGVTVRHIWEDGPDVIAWYDLATAVAPPGPVAEWYHVEDDGLISRIAVVFDARPFAPPSE